MSEAMEWDEDRGWLKAGEALFPKVPLRLWIAAHVTTPLNGNPKTAAVWSLRYADALIDLHEGTTGTIDKISADQQRILNAIEKHFPNGEKVVKQKIADELGYAASNLSGSDCPVGKAWRILEKAGKISGWPSQEVAL